MTRILWIEDSARLELGNLTGPIYSIDEFDFNLAEDVTTGVKFLRSRPYDVIIVDMRLPPGSDPAWEKLYQKAGKDKARAHLGMKFLQWALGREDGVGYPPPQGLTPLQFGVFTVEAYEDCRQDLAQLGVKVFQRKAAGLPDDIIVQLIRDILARKMRIG